jgi:hypothetical protein
MWWVGRSSGGEINEKDLVSLGPVVVVNSSFGPGGIRW